MASSFDLLRVVEVQDALLQSSGAVEQKAGVVERAISDAHDAITTFLKQDPMIHRTKQGVRRLEWREDQTLDSIQWRAWADEQPVVEIQSPSEVSIRHDSEQFLRDGPAPLTVDYHAGYRRQDQSLSDLQSALGDLTTDPPRLPDDIRRVGLLLAGYYITQAEHGPGIGQVEQVVGSGGATTISGTDSGFVERQLQRLSEYRRLAP